MSTAVPFRLVESRDPDGVLHIAVHGELDVVVADQFSLRLEQLAADRIPVRIDLSGLSFIDSSGIRTLIVAMRDGHDLVEVRREVSPSVQVALDLLGITPIIWPDSAGDPEVGSRLHRPPDADTGS